MQTDCEPQVCSEADSQVLPHAEGSGNYLLSHTAVRKEEHHYQCRQGKHKHLCVVQDVKMCAFTAKLLPQFFPFSNLQDNG